MTQARWSKHSAGGCASCKKPVVTQAEASTRGEGGRNRVREQSITHAHLSLLRRICVVSMAVINTRIEALP